jgi:serine/threonine-protein kinase
MVSDVCSRRVHAWLTDSDETKLSDFGLSLAPLVSPDPIVFTQGSLRNLCEGAMEAQAGAGRPAMVHRTIPVGQYERAVVPTGRGKSAVQAVLKGMPAGKLIEMFTPLTYGKEATSRPVIAIWIYQEASMAVVHLDFQQKERYILWHAPDAQQFNFDYREELRQRLVTVDLEVPGGLDQALVKK